MAGEPAPTAGNPAEQGYTPLPPASDGGSTPEDDKKAYEELKNTQGRAKHFFTDYLCLVIFIAYVVGIGYVMNYALENGDVRRLYKGMNYIGDLCGVDPVVEDKPMLFWCGKPGMIGDTGIPTSLNFDNPICVESCPKSDEDLVLCPQPSETKMERTKGKDGEFEVTTTIVQNVEREPGYPSKSMLAYCFPTDLALSAQLFAEGPLSGYTSQVMMVGTSAMNASHVLITVAVLSFVLGYAYLFFLKLFAKPLVVTVLLLLIGALFGASGYCILTATSTAELIPDLDSSGDSGVKVVPTDLDVISDEDGISEKSLQKLASQYPNLFTPIAGDYAVETSYVAGGILAVLALVLTVMLFCAKESLEAAVACVQEATNTMFAMPSLLLQPATEVLVKILVYMVLGYGFGWVLSCGEITGAAAEIGGAKVAGVNRDFSYTEEQIYMILYYIFGMFWIDEIFTALGQFVVSYSVVLYYFAMPVEGKKVAPSFPMFRGYAVGLGYHLGTLAFGAFLIAVVRLVRLIISYIAKQAEKEGNAALACVAKILVCVVTCFKKCMEFINKNAWMDVAIRSSNFCIAAKNAVKTIFSEAALMSLLNGSCFVFQIAGAGLITATGYLTAEKAVTSIEAYSVPTSELYVTNPQGVGIVGGLIGLSIAVPFMLVFDQCADTLLYCYVVDKQLPAPKEYVPENFKGLMSKYDK
jgi:hypothetical protein